MGVLDRFKLDGKTALVTGARRGIGKAMATALAEAGAAVALINEAAADAGREVEPDHFGLSLPVALDGIPESLRAAIGRRRPHTDPEVLVAAGWDGARRMIEQYVEAGLSKFVVRPATRPEPFGSFTDGFVRELMPMQN